MQFQTSLFHFLRHSLKTTTDKTRFLSTFKSSLSLKNLYPESSISITTPVKLPENGNLKFNGYIPVDKLNITYSKSSGPGGQHINNVNTKVDIRFNLESAEWLDEDVKKKLSELYKSRINKDGFFTVRSEKTRSQILNQADAITILREMLFSAAKACVFQEPSQESLHILRKRKERANLLRLADKKQHALKKLDRKVPEF